MFIVANCKLCAQWSRTELRERVVVHQRGGSISAMKKDFGVEDCSRALCRPLYQSYDGKLRNIYCGETEEEEVLTASHTISLTRLLSRDIIHHTLAHWVTYLQEPLSFII